MSGSSACGDEVMVVSSDGGAGGGGGSSGAATGGEAGAGGQPPVCGPDCWACCNDSRCPEEEPETGAPCTNEGNSGTIYCSYQKDDGCLYEYFRSASEPEFFSMHVEPTDCPGICTASSPIYADAPCLDVGKTCPHDDEPGECFEHTCQDNYIWESHPCP